MKLDSYFIERAALLIGWQVSKSYQGMNNSNFLDHLSKRLNNNKMSAYDEFVCCGLLEAFSNLTNNNFINEYSGRMLIKRFSNELYEDYYDLIEAYTNSRQALHSNNGAVIAATNTSLNFSEALYIMLGIDNNDLQDWKWVGGRYPWEYQGNIEPHKALLLNIFSKGKEYLVSEQSFEEFFHLDIDELQRSLGYRELING